MIYKISRQASNDIQQLIEQKLNLCVDEIGKENTFHWLKFIKAQLTQGLPYQEQLQAFLRKMNKSPSINQHLLDIVSLEKELK